ncbi:biotin transporter BioY [Endozoicomonas sp. Mp262]|uniref:biotin transporter BioY n=1 Tax=Endozoicomonas sp. Mp262 TaxID=2919499 RepID=UPI0021D9088E
MSAVIQTAAATSLEVKVDAFFRPLALFFSGIVLLTLGSKIYIPIEPVPITAQTVALFLISLTFGHRLAVASVLGWLGLGACGLPVFASHLTGVTVFTGPTAGYLFGFLLVSGVCGYLAEKAKECLSGSLDKLIAISVLGHVILYLSGLWWLHYFVGSWQNTFLAGLYPFIIGDALKIILVVLCVPGTWKLKNRC